MIIANKSYKIEGTTKQGVQTSITTFAHFVDITKTLCNMNLFLEKKNVFWEEVVLTFLPPLQ